jgi:hypothetical protein
VHVRVPRLQREEGGIEVAEGLVMEVRHGGAVGEG